MARYAILTPDSEMIGFIECDGIPTVEACADKLAEEYGFTDRNAFLFANPEIKEIGFAPIH